MPRTTMRGAVLLLVAVTLTCGLNVRGLRTFRTVCYLELHFLAFVQSLPTIHADRGVMHKDVLAFICCDEAVAFGVIEPFNYTVWQEPTLLFDARKS